MSYPLGQTLVPLFIISRHPDYTSVRKEQLLSGRNCIVSMHLESRRDAATSTADLGDSSKVNPFDLIPDRFLPLLLPLG